MRADHAEAIALVKSGLSFSEAAGRVGLTRNAVAGACDRAGVKVGLSEHRRKRMGTMSSERLRALWSARSAAWGEHGAARKARIMAPMQAARRAWWASLSDGEKANRMRAMAMRAWEVRRGDADV